MRRLFLILLLILCGAGPAQKRLLLSQGEQSDEQWIRNLAPTLWLDSDDARSTWTTATAVELWKDKRGDNRENRLTYSEALNNAAWMNENASGDAADHIVDTANTSHHRLIHDVTLALVSYQVGCEFKNDTVDYVWLGEENGAAWNGINVKLTDGTIDASSNVTSSAVGTVTADGFYPVSFIYTPDAAGTINMSIYLSSAAAATPPSYAATGAKKVYARKCFVRRTFADSQYHPTTTTAKLAGDNWPRFVQATAANMPAVTRRDNRENRVANSDVITTWSAYRATISDPVLTEDGTASNTHGVNQNGGAVVAGERYRVCARVKLKERHASLRLDASAGLDAGYAHFNLTTCAVHSVTGNVGSATATADADYCIICAEETGTAAGTAYPTVAMASAPGTTSYNGDSSSGLYIDWMQWQSSLADGTHLATTTVPAYRGVNGRQAVRFDGANDKVTSGGALSAMIAAAAYTSFAVIQPASLAAAGSAMDVIRADAGANLRLYIDSATGYYLNNADGSTDETTPGVALVANKPVVLQMRHDGGSIYISANGGTASSVASGNTADLTETVNIGDNSSSNRPYSGYVGEVITFNKVLGSSERARVQRYLCRKWGASC